MKNAANGPGGIARFLVAGVAALALSGCETVPPVDVPGTVLAATPIDQAGENTGAGAITGMVIGGVAGGSLGHGAGQVIGAEVGVLAGGVAGSAAESAAQTHDGMAYTIKLADGRVVTILEHLNPGEPVFTVGSAVRLESSGREQRVVPPAT